jgi:hypothetical protein
MCRLQELCLAGELCVTAAFDAARWIVRALTLTRQRRVGVRTARRRTRPLPPGNAAAAATAATAAQGPAPAVTGATSSPFGALPVDLPEHSLPGAAGAALGSGVGSSNSSKRAVGDQITRTRDDDVSNGSGDGAGDGDDDDVDMEDSSSDDSDERGSCSVCSRDSLEEAWAAAEAAAAAFTGSRRGLTRSKSTGADLVRLCVCVCVGACV